MAVPGKLTDAELLRLIQQTAHKQVIDVSEQENASGREKEAASDGQLTVANLPVERMEPAMAASKSETQGGSVCQGEAQSVLQTMSASDLQTKSLFSITPVAQQVVDMDDSNLPLTKQSKNQKEANTISQSNESSLQQLVTQSSSTAVIKEVSQSDVMLLQTMSQSSVTSPVKEVAQSNVISPMNDISQTSALSPTKQTADSEKMTCDKSVLQMDVVSPSYKIDAELVAMLTKEEITNLVHEYRTELDDTKKRLEKSERQLAKANDYNDVLRNMVEKLSSEIHRVRHMKTCSVHVQVDKEDFLEYTTGRSSMPNWIAEDDNNSVPMDIAHTEEMVVKSESTDTQQPTETESGTLSIADSIKQAAEAVVEQQQADMLHDSGYMYDEHSGLYYHSATGYYYDQQKSLFYDPKTGIYYYYDYDTGEYKFHSQFEFPSQTQATEQSVVKVNIPFKKKYSESKRSLKTPRTNKSRERYSSGEKVHKNRKERRRAEQDKTERRHRRKREDRHDRRYSPERGRKRRRHKSHRSGSSRSRSRTSSCDRGRKKSLSQGRDKRSLVSGDRRKRSRKDRKRNSNSEKSSKNRKHGVSSESGDSDVQIVKDNHHEKSKKEVKGRTKSLDSSGTRKKSGSRGDPVNRSKSEEVAKSCGEGDTATVRDDEDEDPGIGNEANTVEDYELESENELMIIVDETNDTENEVSEISSDEKSVHGEKKEIAEVETSEDSKHVHSSKSNKSNKHLCQRSRSRERRKYHHKRKSEKRNRKETTENRDSGSETESGELSDTDSEYSSYSKSYSSYTSESDEEDLYVDVDELDEQEETEVAGSYPPCIRMMVVESDCLDIGSLYIVTCTGAKIGRENCDICIPDLNVSKVHSEIYYNESSNQYEIFDCASQNGTYLNDQRLSPAKIASEPFVVSHGDTVLVSTTKILCHIHPGSDTCDQCEPGVVIATHKAQQPQTELKVLSKEERLRQKKQELNQIKKRYGLKNSAYENNPEVFNNPSYTDKAEQRRKHVGSDVPGQKSEAPASVHRPISTGNVGHKLLQKMGWKEGDSLGKNNTGIQEPISVTLRASQKAGLGSTSAGSYSADDVNTVDMKKATRRVRAQQRYKQIETGKSERGNNSGDKLWTQGDTEYT